MVTVLIINLQCLTFFLSYRIYITASLRGHSKLAQLILDAYPEGARVLDAGVVWCRIMSFTVLCCSVRSVPVDR